MADRNQHKMYRSWLAIDIAKDFIGILLSILGIGPIIALIILAEVGADITRLGSVSVALAAYFAYVRCTLCASCAI